jgi:hypothetical protein
MKTTLTRVFSRRLDITFCAATMILLCGCGSGLVTPLTGSSNPATPAATAQSPQLGYFWNAPDQTLRPIVGIPGSSQVGQSVVPAGTYTAAAASSASAAAVLQDPDGSLDVMTLPTGQPVHISAATTTGAQIRFSPAGKFAIVFTPGARAFSLLTGLPSTPSASLITSTFAIQEATISDAGNIAAATSNSTGISIQIVAANGAATSVGSVGALGGLAFASGDSLLFADASANTLTLVQSASTKPSPTLVPTAALLMTPSGLGVSQNGQWALVANTGEASAIRIDLTAQNAPLRIACACTPALVAPLSGMGTFRITAAGMGPIWAIDAGVSAPRSFFIPAVHP